MIIFFIQFYLFGFFPSWFISKKRYINLRIIGHFLDGFKQFFLCHNLSYCFVVFPNLRLMISV